MAVNGFRTYTKTNRNFGTTFAACDAMHNFKFTIRQFFIYLRCFYDCHGLSRNYALALRHAKNALAYVLRVGVFNKQSVNAGIKKLFEKRRCRSPRYNCKSSIWRPAFGFEKDFKTVRPGHTQIKQCTVWFKPFNQSNGFDSVLSCSDDIQARNQINSTHHAFDDERVIIGNNNCDTHSAPQKYKFCPFKIGLFKRFVQALVIFAACLSVNEGATAQTTTDYLRVDGARSSEDLSPHIDYLLDPSWNLTAADMLGEQAHNFKPIPTTEPDFGYIDSRIWLRFRIENESASIRNWRIYVRENFLQYYDVYVVRSSGQIEQIEKHDPDTTFFERSIAYPELVSPLRLNEGERVTIFISYWSGGSSHAALSLETTKSFSDLAVSRTSKNYLSYGIMMILILITFLALIVLKRKVFWAYLSYVGCTLVYLIHIDGVAFQFFWPNAPHFNSYFTIIIGTFFVIFTYNFARVFLQTERYHPRTDKFFMFMAALTPIITITGAFVDPQFTKQLIFVLIFMAILFGAITGCVASLTRFRQVGFYLLAWACGIFTAGLMSLRHNFGFEVTQDAEFDAIRLSIIVDAVMMGIGVADHYTQTVKARQAQTESNLAIAKKNLQLNNRLFDLEKQYELVSELVKSRDNQIRDTVHDLRQPLHALRLRVQKIENGQNLTPSDIGHMDNSFSYLEDLIASHLEDTISEQKLTASTMILNGDASEQGELALPNILVSIYEMFLPDAVEKGLEFTYVPSTKSVDVNPLILMRVVSNLVSNAIKYTSSGKIVFGVRRRANGLSIQIHDSGIGMSAADFERAKQRAVRLETEEVIDAVGHGYGLTIANELATEEGWILRLIDGRSSGSSIAVDIDQNAVF